MNQFILAADANFLGPLRVVLRSLEETQVPGTYGVVVLVPDQTVVEQVPEGSHTSVEWVVVDRDLIDGAQLPANYPAATTFRLSLDQLGLWPGGRVVYLDADVLVCADLTDLFHVDLGDAAIAAVRDPVAPWVSHGTGVPWRDESIDPTTAYFNSGVLVIDVERWRDRDLGRRSLAMLRERELVFADQCALNTVTAGSWARLDPRFNVQAGHLPGITSAAYVVEEAPVVDAAVRNPAIVHFNSSPAGRPWVEGNWHPFAPQWCQVAQRAGVVPADLPRTPRQRLTRRLRRAAWMVLKG
jgi:lipopolysaccharide biosynthesis glycosyltransferase